MIIQILLSQILFIQQLLLDLKKMLVSVFNFTDMVSKLALASLRQSRK